MMKWLSIPLKDEVTEEVMDQIIDLVRTIIEDLDVEQIFIDDGIQLEEEQ